MKNKTFIIIIFLCFLPLLCKGQFCKLYSTHGDISSSMINHIYQDSKGYIWVSTEDGLNKYDGAKFVNYKIILMILLRYWGIMYTKHFKTAKAIYTYSRPKDFNFMITNQILSLP